MSPLDVMRAEREAEMIRSPVRQTVMGAGGWLLVASAAFAQSAPPGAPAPQAAPAYWGAIAFTADGSYATAWKQPSKAEAEADVAKRCAKFGRGACEVAAFPGQMCAALATYIGSHSRRRYRLSFTAGGLTSPEAQQKALQRCNDDSRTRGRCQLRTVVCGDGR